MSRSRRRMGDTSGGAEPFTALGVKIVTLDEVEEFSSTSFEFKFEGPFFVVALESSVGETLLGFKKLVLTSSNDILPLPSSGRRGGGGGIPSESSLKDPSRSFGVTRALSHIAQ